MCEEIRSLVCERIKTNVRKRWEKAIFPKEIVPEMGSLGLFGIHLKGYGCAERSTVAVGFVIAEEGQGFDEDEILEWCRKDLAKFKVPRRIIALPGFPKTESANGIKVKREELREMAAEALETEEARSSG